MEAEVPENVEVPPEPAPEADQSHTEVHKKPAKRKRSKKGRKVPGAPKHPKNGYVRFCDFYRPTVCAENPARDPVEVTKIVAQKWYSLTSEEKLPYLEAAKVDAERFKKEVEIFKAENPEEGATLFKKKRRSKSQIKAAKLAALAGESSPVPLPTSSEPKVNGTVDPLPKPKKEEISFVAGLNCELPIYTDAFLEHNKAIEADLKILRKSNQEIEQQNSILMKHVENMEAGVERVEKETFAITQQNMQLEIYLSKLKYQLANEFHALHLPSIQSGATLDNIDVYMAELSKEAASMKDPGLLGKARDILKKCNLSM